MDHDSEKKEEFINALNTYYKLKQSYEDNYKKEKNQIIKLKNLRWKERRKDFMQLKPQCINCGRHVGSMFYTHVEKEERQLVAKCGDKINPCPLNIVINLGYIINLQFELANDEKKIEKTKKEIIIDKNDLLFGYITSTEAINKFDKIKKEYASTIDNYEFYLKILNDIIHNKEKKEETDRLQADIQLMIDNYKILINSYEKSQNKQFINDAIEMFVKEIIPRLKELRNKKYLISEIDFNKDDNTFHLVQLPVLIDNFEFDIAANEHGVVSLKIGNQIKEKKSHSKTMKNTSTSEEEFKIKVPKKQTKKNRKKSKSESESEPYEIVENDGDKEEEEEEEEEEDNEQEDKERNELENIENELDSTIKDDYEEEEEIKNLQREGEEEENLKREEGEEYEEEAPLPKIIIYPKLLPDGTIAASEANRLKYKIELVKGELITSNPQTNEIYKVTAGK